MPTRRLQALTLVAAMLLLALPPNVARAGDAPILVVDDWGVGEIDGKIMFYLGEGRYLDTPIPAPSRGPRWDVAYNALPVVAIAGVALWLYRRRHSQTLQGRKSHRD